MASRRLAAQRSGRRDMGAIRDQPGTTDGELYVVVVSSKAMEEEEGGFPG